jgi:sialate O-acetylesterase
MKKTKNIIAISAGFVVVVLLLVFLYLYYNGLSDLYAHTVPTDTQIKVACVGDSITYGHGITNWPKNNYPAVLGSILGDDYHVQNFGQRGTTLQKSTDRPYTKGKPYAQSLEYSADILVFMLGSNDSITGRWIDAEAFIADYEEIVNSYKENNPDIRIILCTPACAFFDGEQNSGETDFGLRPSIIKEIATRIRSFALAKSYELVDVYDLTQNHPEWFEADNVHPSNDGARAIAQLVASKIKSK